MARADYDLIRDIKLDDIAIAVWEKISSNLEDRSVLHLGDIDDGTYAELSSEQIGVIVDVLRGLV